MLAEEKDEKRRESNSSSTQKETENDKARSRHEKKMTFIVVGIFELVVLSFSFLISSVSRTSAKTNCSQLFFLRGQWKTKQNAIGRERRRESQTDKRMVVNE